MERRPEQRTNVWLEKIYNEVKQLSDRGQQQSRIQTPPSPALLARLRKSLFDWFTLIATIFGFAATILGVIVAWRSLVVSKDAMFIAERARVEAAQAAELSASASNQQEEIRELKNAVLNGNRQLERLDWIVGDVRDQLALAQSEVKRTVEKDSIAMLYELPHMWEDMLELDDRLQQDMVEMKGRWMRPTLAQTSKYEDILVGLKSNLYFKKRPDLWPGIQVLTKKIQALNYQLKINVPNEFIFYWFHCIYLETQDYLQNPFSSYYSKRLANDLKKSNICPFKNEVY